MIDPLKTLSKRLKLQFDDISLLQTALTHRSAAANNYERLEFLGDGALNFVIAGALYKLKTDCDEGSLSRLRANLVRGITLGEIAKELKLSDFLLLGPGELKSGGFLRESILADVVEAIIGAVYIDKGFDAAQEFILRLYDSRLQNLPDVKELIDPKTRLQEYLQSRGHGLPIYTTLDVRGKSHEQVFFVDCVVEKLSLKTKANAASRRKAEHAAALIMINQIDNQKKQEKKS